MTENNGYYASKKDHSDQKEKKNSSQSNYPRKQNDILTPKQAFRFVLKIEAQQT